MIDDDGCLLNVMSGVRAVVTEQVEREGEILLKSWGNAAADGGDGAEAS